MAFFGGPQVHSLMIKKPISQQEGLSTRSCAPAQSAQVPKQIPWVKDPLSRRAFEGEAAIENRHFGGSQKTEPPFYVLCANHGGRMLLEKCGVLLAGAWP